MLTVTKPSVVVMTLSFVAQALVVTIVGVNMAFRLMCAYVHIYKYIYILYRY